MIKHIRVSSQARDQLIRMKSKTGIGQWNVLCRWALAMSLRELTPPTVVEIPADSNVEMSWQVFGGEYGELYWAIVKARCFRDGLGTEESTVAQQFRLHLHRGIGYLATPNAIRSIRDLLALTQETRDEAAK